jgi:hypothetical protein
MCVYDPEKLQNTYRADRDQGGEQAVLDFGGTPAVAQQLQDRTHGFPLGIG